MMDSELDEFIKMVVVGDIDFAEAISTENRRSIIGAIQYQAGLLEQKPIDFVIRIEDIEIDDQVYHITDGWIVIKENTLNDSEYCDKQGGWHCYDIGNDSPFYSIDIIRGTPKPIDWSTLPADTMLTKSSNQSQIFYFIGYSSMVGIIYYRCGTVTCSVSIDDSSNLTLA